MIKNTSESYGWVSIGLHWLVALTVLGLFCLGLYMVDLTYYDELYHTLPHIHQSIGMLLFLAMVFRLLWRLLNPAVNPLSSHSDSEILISRFVHWLLYLSIFTAMLSGYFISTADGSPIGVLNWFQVPALLSSIDNLEDVAGEVHEISVWAMIGLVALHVAGAIKHKVIDRDSTINRIIRPR